MIREAVLLPGTELGEGAVLVGGLSATNPDRPLG